jgi:tetratricopeptide (TPR) repeat protein
MCNDSQVNYTLEKPVAYQSSLQWRLHRAYFVARGQAAWTENTIPYAATTNAPIARQHIHVLLCLIDELESAGTISKDEGLAVLEVGAGSGQFAQQIFEALAHDFGSKGLKLRERLTWILSDFSRPTVDQAIATDAIKALVTEGKIVPALYDLTDPSSLTTLNQDGLHGRVIGMVASYVGCVLPIRYLRKHNEKWSECWVSLQVNLPDDAPAPSTPAEVLEKLIADIDKPLDECIERNFDWHPVQLDDAVTRELHAATISAAVQDLDDATVGYPEDFFNALLDAKQRLVDGGIIFVNDLGKADHLAMAGLHDPLPTMYGNTLNHSINFSLLEPLARNGNFGLLRTVDKIGQLQQAIIRHGPPLTQSLEDVFRTWYVNTTDHQDLLDFEKAGQQAFQAGDYRRAMRLYRKCVVLAPRNPDLYYGLGRACLMGGLFSEAVESLEAGYRLDPELRLDFDFHLGRAFGSLGYHQQALEWYQQSVGRDPHPVTFSNMAETYFQKEDYDNAYLHWRKSLQLDPSHASALEGIERLKLLFFQQRVASLDDTLASPDKPTNNALSDDTTGESND